jgi:hypothetical protein
MTMKKIIIGFMCLIFTLSLSSCAWKTAVLSEKEPLKSYIGTSGTLQIPMTLREQRKHTYRFVPHTIGEEGKWLSWEVREICKIPVGTKISITDVKMVFIEGGRLIYLIGTLENPETSELIEFEIYLGSHNPESKEIWLRRMPWEDQNLPEDRHVPLTNHLFWSDWLL